MGGWVVFPKTVKFEVVERVNKFKDTGKEFALNCRFDDGDWWTITVFTQKPDAFEIEACKSIVIRSFQIYGKHITTPKYKDVKALR